MNHKTEVWNKIDERSAMILAQNINFIASQTFFMEGMLAITKLYAENQLS